MARNSPWGHRAQKPGKAALQAKFQQGLILHQQGRLAEAEGLYEEVLRRGPIHFDALHLLGVLALQTGRPHRGIDLIAKAIKQNGNVPAAHNNLGTGLSDLNRYEEALTSYGKAIALKADYAEAYNNRGNALDKLKRHEEALTSYDKAVGLTANYAEAHFGRGNALNNLKRFEEALASYDRAIDLRPDYAEALHNRGLTLAVLKRFDEALLSHDRALAVRPDYAEALCNRGITLHELRRFEEALASYDGAIAVRPDYADALSNRGVTLDELKRFDEALASYDRAISLRPEHALALYNRGNTLRQLRRFDDALLSYDHAISLQPDHAVALYNRGNTLRQLKRFDEALLSYDRALSLWPDYADALCNRGVTLHQLRRFEEALLSYDRAIAVQPDYAKAHLNRGITLLLAGELSSGFPDFEWRLALKEVPNNRANINAASWRGQELEGRRLLVFSEQGLGDIIQFARYLPLLAQKRCKLTFLTDAKLTRLLRPLTNGIEVISSLRTEGKFDFQCALMSLPHRLRTDLTSIPNRVPYLRAEDALIARWRERIGGHGFKVGIAWQGDPQGTIDQGRSIPLAEYFSLAQLPGVRLISLQRHHGLDQLAAVPKEVTIETFGEDLDNGPDAFIDTAAVMSNLDLIITSDTSIAHVAGALGHRVWVALKCVPHWVWMLDREDSPWYPTMRLFRQSERDNWKPVFSNMERELRSLADGCDGKTSSVYSFAPPSNPTVQVSWGEYIDKITILEIKQERFVSVEAVANVRRELAALRAAQDDIHMQDPRVTHLTNELRAINEALWEIENKIRAKEAAESFDREFVDLARAVYFQNDKRANVKRQINVLMKSNIVEEKQYTSESVLAEARSGRGG